jgi:uncharacterized Zn finger protein (UPF0148 family)
MIQVASDPCPRCETGALRTHEDGVFCVNCGTVFYASKPVTPPRDLRSAREGTRWRRAG